jgi:hypothetical protein
MNSSRFHLVGALAGLGLLSATACFGYYAPLSNNLSGRRIELSLTDSGALALAPRVGNGVEAVEGTLVADSANLFMMSVLGTRRRDGQENSWRGESVNVPHSMVSAISERRFSRARTTLFLSATTAALVATWHSFRGVGGATVPGNTNGGSGPK